MEPRHFHARIFFERSQLLNTLDAQKSQPKKDTYIQFLQTKAFREFFLSIFLLPFKKMYFPTAGIDLESEKPLWRCGITWGLKTRIPLNDGENSGEHFDAKRFFKGLVCVCLLICWLHFG